VNAERMGSREKKVEQQLIFANLLALPEKADEE
jgi:hypothetical protein